MIQKTSFAVLSALALSITSSATWAASFDCTKARATDEKAVCTNLPLNDMDVTMALLFNLDKRFLPMGGRDALIDQQKAWLVSRKACGSNVACLTDLYQQRIRALQQIIETRVVTRGPF